MGDLAIGSVTEIARSLPAASEIKSHEIGLRETPPGAQGGTPAFYTPGPGEVSRDTSFSKLLKLSDLPTFGGATDPARLQVGGLKVENEKDILSRQLDRPGDSTRLKDEIVSGAQQLAQKTITFMVFWGTIKKTQTEFKQMSHGQ